MTDRALEEVVERITELLAGWPRGTPMAQMRHDYDAFFTRGEVAVEVTPVLAGGVPASWFDARDAGRDAAGDGRVVLYCHGGGFHIGSTRSHHGLIARLSAAACCRILALDYRLASEHCFPAPLEDALAAYDWLLAQGYAPSHIAFSGDSAGGGLVLSTLLALRDRGRSLPVAAAVLSPWCELEASGDSYFRNEAVDPLGTRKVVLAMARSYLGSDRSPRDPMAAPLHGDLAGLPPLMIQCGERDMLLDDSLAFAKKAQAAGVAVTLERWPGMIHVFQLFAAELPQAREAIANLGAFLQEELP
ncbi:MAG: alpha/beta hydrolase [Pseudomonadota bacterium]